MKEHPILFNGEMVRAILDGRKTQTRRVIQFRDLRGDPESHNVWKSVSGWHDGDERIACPYGVPGDRLWVRETWATIKQYDHLSPSAIPHGGSRWPAVWYDSHPEAAASITSHKERGYEYQGRIRPSIHMPRWASRITLEVTDVRVERVQEISESDAKAEGVLCDLNCRRPFMELWDSINAARGYSWESNPFVWVIEFQRVTP